MPLARAMGMGSTFDWADHSNRVCFLLRSTISWPVIAGVAVAVVMLMNSCFSFAALWRLDNFKTTEDTKVHERNIGELSFACPDENVWAYVFLRTCASALWPSAPPLLSSPCKTRPNRDPGRA